MLRRKGKLILSTVVIAIALVFIPRLALGESARTLGIDVSNHQGSIDWNSVYGAGIRFAFCKATEGLTFDDSWFKTNMDGATSAGVLIGPYHFCHPDSNGAEAEATHFVNVIKPYMKDGYLRPVLDLEDGTSLGKTALTNWVLSFCSYVEVETGIAPLIYCNLNFASNYLDSRATKYDLWIAHWGVSTPGTGVWSTWKVWQYTSTGSVSGVSGNVDRDYFNGDLAAMQEALLIGQASPPIKYDRQAAYDYAYTWWDDRNPAYADYSGSGGDCANFVSQCIIAGGVDLHEGTNGAGAGVDRYGTMPFCDYLDINLKKYQDASVTYYVEGSSSVPDEVTVGDVVQFGVDGGDRYMHAMIVVIDRGTNLGLAGHTNDRWDLSFSSAIGSSSWNCATFYHINSGSGGGGGGGSDSGASWPTLKYGAQGEDVRTLQYLLTARGYSLAIDGDFGSETESRVIDFQRGKGLTVDGIVGPQTWSTLVMTLKSGSSGSAVTTLQRQLHYVYGYSLAIDGAFGSETDSIVRAFQSYAKIDVDGIVGPITWRHLLGLKSGDSGGTVPPPSPSPAWPIVRYGSQGEDVYTLQYLLTARGYSLGIDGIFGYETENTVKSFQSAKGVSVDGIVGQQTWSALVITLQTGSSGSAVTALQRQLHYVYGYSLAIDGAFGSETTKWVRAFQSYASIDIDGIVGPTTWRNLLGLKSGASSGTGGTAPSWPTLRSGSQSEDVRTLQYLLIARGYSLTADGIFGSGTEGKVKAFQSAKGLSVDGIVGPQTWGALIIMLQSGSSGRAITALQRQLRNTYGYSLGVDGSFGPETDRNVRAFQSYAQIDVDGIVGPVTWRYLLGKK